MPSDDRTAWIFPTIPVKTARRLFPRPRPALRRRLAVQAQGPAEDRRIAPELRVPAAAAQHDRRRQVGPVARRRSERAPERGGAAQLLKEIRGDELHLQRLRDNLADCIGCGCLSLRSCALTNPGDVLAKQGPGPVRL